MDEVDFTVLAATSVFTDLMEKCPPAEACRDAFDRTVKATIKMANSTGGFGQTLNPKSSRNNNDHQNQASDWLSQRTSHPRRHRGSIDELTTATATASDLGSISDAYSNSASSMSHLPVFSQRQFRLKNEHSDSSSNFSHLRNPPAPPRSNASGGSSVAAAAPAESISNVNPIGSQGATPEALDPSSLMDSPVAGQLGSPVLGMPPPPQAGSLFNSGGGLGFGSLQDMDFLQGLGGGGDPTTSGLEGAAGVVDFGFGEPMDLGFGLGWEGMHHDFSDGQQVDLFDGFFFGGQQGAGGGGAGI
jgi:hypothetical protein